MGTKFGIVGCGGIAKRFAKALQLSEAGELYAAAARDKVRAQTLIDEYGGQVAYDSYLSLITDANVEIVYIALIHNLHFEVAKQCIENGKTVICEKPFFCSEEEAITLKQLAKEKGVLIMEAMWARCLPAFLKAKEWAKNGSIGKVKFIDAKFCFRVPLSEETEKNRLYDSKTAGGALLDAGVYPYEFVTGILDEYPVDIKAVAQMADTGVDETVSMGLKFKSGVLANGVASIGVKTNWMAHIYGTDGYIKVSDFLWNKKCERFNSQDELMDTFFEDFEEGFVFEIEHIIKLYKNRQLDSNLIPIDDSVDFGRAADKVKAQFK